MVGNPFALVLLLMVVLGYSVEEVSTAEKCLSPDASVCRNDGKNCLQELFGVGTECDMEYSKLYKGRLDADFSVKMDGNGKFLIAVYSSETRSFTGIVEECCGIEEGENCTLRPISKSSESFNIVYLDDEKSCFSEVQEYEVPKSWCNENATNRPCLELNEKRELVIYSEWVDLNLAVYKQLYKDEYCFFDMVPEEFVRNRTKQKDGFIHIEEFELSQKEPTPRISGVNESCFKRWSDEVNFNTYLVNRTRTFGYTTCFLLAKVPNRMHCYKPPTAKDDQKNQPMRTFWITILGVVAISVVTICALLAMWFCRKSFPSFRKTEKQISDTLKNIESGENLIEDDQNLDGRKNEIHETPDEIIFKDEIIIDGQAEDEEVTPMLPEQPQTYSNFDNTIGAGCDREFSSFPLPSLRGNIKDGYTEKWAGVKENGGSWHDHNFEETHCSLDSANDPKQHRFHFDSGFDLPDNEKTASYQNSDKTHSFKGNDSDPMIQSPSSLDSGFDLRGNESVASDQNSDEAHISAGSGKNPTVQVFDSRSDVRFVKRALHGQDSVGENISVDRETESSQLSSRIDSGFDLDDEKASHNDNFVGCEKEPSQFSFQVDDGFDLCGENPNGVDEVFVKSNFGEYTKKSFLIDNDTGHANPCPGTFDGYVQKAIA